MAHRVVESTSPWPPLSSSPHPRNTSSSAPTVAVYLLFSGVGVSTPTPDSPRQLASSNQPQLPLLPATPNQYLAFQTAISTYPTLIINLPHISFTSSSLDPPQHIPFFVLPQPEPQDARIHSERGPPPPYSRSERYVRRSVLSVGSRPSRQARTGTEPAHLLAGLLRLPRQCGAVRPFSLVQRAGANGFVFVGARV